jgi:putative hemolysin
MEDQQENNLQEVENQQLLDLEKVIADKNPRLLKLIPGFVMRYMRRILHVDDMNEILKKNQGISGLAFVQAGLDELDAKIVVVGQENIPEKERFIAASNHPLGGPDGLTLINVVGKVRPDVIFPVNDILMNVPNLKELFIPINKHGRNAENMKLMDDTFASDVAMLYFPAGMCSRKQSGKIMDLEWKKTFITKAKKFQRWVLPVHIEGKNTNFFYNLANLRKRLGIKANLEMFYLVDEMYKQKRKTLKITFGEPIHYNVFDKRFTDKEWAGLIREYIYLLAKDPGFTFNSFLNHRIQAK